VRLLSTGVPSWAVARAGMDLAGGIPGSAAVGQAAGYCEIPWFGHFVVYGAARHIAASEHYPVLGERWRGKGGKKKYPDFW
jgi:hypothetical protein